MNFFKNNEDFTDKKSILSSFGNLLPALAIIAGGVLLAVYPALSAQILSRGAGIVMAIYGIVMIVLYFSRDIEHGILRNSLMRGFLFLGFGIFVIVKPTVIANILPFILGVLLICGSAYKLQVAFDVWRMREKKWFLFIVAGVAMLVLGVIILLNPFKTAGLLMRIIGIGLLLEGILDIVAMVSIRQVRKRFAEMETISLSDVIDAQDSSVYAYASTEEDKDK